MPTLFATGSVKLGGAVSTSAKTGATAAKFNPPPITSPSPPPRGPVPNIQFTIPTNTVNGPTPQQRMRDNGKKIADANPILAAGIDGMNDINIKNGAWAAIGLLATTQDEAEIAKFRDSMDKNWIGGFNVGKNAAIGVQHITPTGNNRNDFGAAIAWNPNTPFAATPGPTESTAFAPPAFTQKQVAPPLFAPEVKNAASLFTSSGGSAKLSSSAPEPVQIPLPVETKKVPEWLKIVLGALGIGGVFFGVKHFTGKKRR